MISSSESQHLQFLMALIIVAQSSYICPALIGSSSFVDILPDLLDFMCSYFANTKGTHVILLLIFFSPSSWVRPLPGLL